MKIFDRQGNLLAETDKEIDLYEHLVIQGKNYLPCSMNIAEKKVEVKEFEPGNSEFERSDEFTCPFCGYVNESASELSSDDGETECGSCGSKLEYSREYTVTYNVTLTNPPAKVVIS